MLVWQVIGKLFHASESGHSIARPTACGSRVPPQRTLALENFPPPCRESLRYCQKLPLRGSC
ncbi:MAG: hypothetical protein EGR21_05780 [Faecalibacterium prausnitzii]|nr:hypothetical protein [Faecalibacterium prausnitzii]MBD9003914.1 hypothetical protein [Faecalibacterium prausnitzii]